MILRDCLCVICPHSRCRLDQRRRYKRVSSKRTVLGGKGVYTKCTNTDNWWCQSLLWTQMTFKAAVYADEGCVCGVHVRCSRRGDVDVCCTTETREGQTRQLATRRSEQGWAGLMLLSNTVVKPSFICIPVKQSTFKTLPCYIKELNQSKLKPPLLF